MSYLNGLNEGQLKAVKEVNGALSVLASAGSGKTKTTITKIVYLIKEVGVFPNHIWAMTFTNKATDEMKSRLVKILGKTEADRVNIGTLHSIAYRVYKGKTHQHLRKSFLIGEGGALNSLFIFLRKYKGRASQDAKAMLSEIGSLKLNGITVDNYKNHYKYEPVSHLQNGNIGYNEIRHLVFKKYEEWKDEHGKMDFQDILVYAVDILENPKNAKYVERLQDSCEYLLLDESQDTNCLCHRIINVLTAKNRNVMAVGDIRQAIFGFQGGNVENVLGFIKKHEAKTVELNVNYRSTSTIVENSNKFITGAKYVGESNTTTPNDVGSDIKYFTSTCAEEEAERVFDKVEELVTSGQYEYRDIAILYRLHSQSMPIEDLLMLNEVPYITYNDNTIFDRKEVKDVLAYLKAVYSPDEFTSYDLKRIVNKPVRYITNKQVTELIKIASSNGLNLLEAIRDIAQYTSDYQMISKFGLLFKGIGQLRRMFLKPESPQVMTEYILNDIGYKDFAIKDLQERDINFDMGMNFDALVGFVSAYRNLGEVFQKIQDFRDKKKEKINEKGNYLKLMTLHASKGREFPVVIMLGNCTELYPFHRNPDEEEERRLVYVGITRPEKELYMSVINGFIGTKMVHPSKYMHMMNFNYNGGSNDH